MKKCIKCGEVGEGKFCAYCGGEVQEINITDTTSKTVDSVKKTLENSKPTGMYNPEEQTIEKTLSAVSIVLSGVCALMGLWKMYAYSDWDEINYYVGGDAYNYIINGTYATAFFVLAGSFLIASIGLQILDVLKKEK